MKRTIIYILCALLLWATGAAEEYTDGDYTYTLNGDGTATVTCWEGDDTELTVPDTLGGCAVTAIGEEAFYGCAIESIALPEGIISIGRNAFAECACLTTIQLPESLTTLGELAFYWCQSLTAIALPAGVTEIGDCTFYYCTDLADVQLPDGLEYIGDYAFSSCRSLTSLRIPDSVTSFGGYVFSGCYSLTILAEEGSAGARYCATHGLNCVPAGARE